MNWRMYIHITTDDVHIHILYEMLFRFFEFLSWCAFCFGFGFVATASAGSLGASAPAASRWIPSPALLDDPWPSHGIPRASVTITGHWRTSLSWGSRCTDKAIWSWYASHLPKLIGWSKFMVVEMSTMSAGIMPRVAWKAQSCLEHSPSMSVQRTWFFRRNWCNRNQWR